MNNFRNHFPKRTCTLEYKNYKRYKPFLVNDFNRRCGYTDSPDFWFGGQKSFHIDHFKPVKKNPTLETTYSNLVYCCSYVNILKSDDEFEYLDPCIEDYNEHFERDSSGQILPKSSSQKAIYMYNKLQLYLKRYGIIWRLDQLYQKMEKVKSIIENPKFRIYKRDLLIIQGELANEFIAYLRYLEVYQ